MRWQWSPAAKQQLWHVYLHYSDEEIAVVQLPLGSMDFWPEPDRYQHLGAVNDKPETYLHWQRKLFALYNSYLDMIPECKPFGSIHGWRGARPSVPWRKKSGAVEPERPEQALLAVFASCWNSISHSHQVAAQVSLEEISFLMVVSRENRWTGPGRLDRWIPVENSLTALALAGNLACLKYMLSLSYQTSDHDYLVEFIQRAISSGNLHAVLSLCENKDSYGKYFAWCYRLSWNPLQAPPLRIEELMVPMLTWCQRKLTSKPIGFQSSLGMIGPANWPPLVTRLFHAQHIPFHLN